MKNKQREPKFELGQQVIISKDGIKGIVECITVENCSKFDYIIGFSISNIQISEKKLLKLNPISSKPKEPENEVITDPFRKAHKALGKALDKLYSRMANDRIKGFPILHSSNLNLALHMAEINKKTTESANAPFCHGDLVEIKRSGVRLYISGASSCGGMYDLGVTWNLGHKAAMEDVTHDSLILIKRNND